ncbi:MAG TPA: hypothetical protein VGJ28_15675 [Micromonosporaceae bacterium]|jgi:hypothetical protein
MDSGEDLTMADVRVTRLDQHRFRISDNSGGNCPEVTFDPVTGIATLDDDFGGSVRLTRSQWANMAAAFSGGLIDFPTA